MVEGVLEVGLFGESFVGSSGMGYGGWGGWDSTWGWGWEGGALFGGRDHRVEAVRFRVASWWGSG